MIQHHNKDNIFWLSLCQQKKKKKKKKPVVHSYTDTWLSQSVSKHDYSAEFSQG